MPNFMYKQLFGEKHRLVHIDMNDLTNRKFQQSGHTEKDILCAKCDNEILGKLERYASNHIYTSESKNTLTRTEFFAGTGESLPFMRYSNLDYNLTKLFFLSILWKAHISSLPFYQEVDLGHQYGEKIRRIFISGDAGREDELEVVLIYLKMDGARPSKSLIEPRCLKENGNTSYVFKMNEIMYHFNITEFNKESLYTKGAVRKDGIMDIGILSGAFARGYFDSYLGRKILMRSNPLE